MNIERGCKRLSYLLLGFLLFILMADAWPDPFRMGQDFAYWLLMCLAYMLVFKAVFWAFRGFKKEA